MPMRTDPLIMQNYQITIKGKLDSQWQYYFEGLSIVTQKDGTTLITGPVADQAALYGLLKKIRNLGLALIAVNPLE